MSNKKLLAYIYIYIYFFYKNSFENLFKVNFLVNGIKINRIYNTNLNNWNEREGEKFFRYI
jgi:hypothetical protein